MLAVEQQIHMSKMLKKGHDVKGRCYFFQFL
uniref:Uncharacterized protein n=1 Tax=Rhizophora mucronata TaxID=61149 RepID=A0A2P2NMW5_RHIMU